MSAAPVVGIVMGSDSDWPVMRAAADALAELDIPVEMDVVSAHRMPTEMIEYGRDASARGLRVIIAGAGGAAHLPGIWTSTTPESAFAKLLLTNGQDFDTMTLQVNENR